MSRLATPAEFEEAAALVSSDELAEKLVLGPDPEAYLAGIESYQRPASITLYPSNRSESGGVFQIFRARNPTEACQVSLRARVRNFERTARSPLSLQEPALNMKIIV